MLKIKIYAEDVSLLKLLTLVLENRDHQVEVFTDSDNYLLCAGDSCSCPIGSRCADAIIINTRKPVLETLSIFRNQRQQGCQLAGPQMVIMSSVFTDLQQRTLESMGYTTIKKPFKLSKIADWLTTCESRQYH